MKFTASILTVATMVAGVAMPSLAGAQQTIPLLGGAQQIHIQSSHDAKTYTGTSFTRVARIDGIQVPAGWTGMFVATFNAESVCNSGPCYMKIVCNGVPLPDSDPFNFNNAEFFAGEPERRTFSVNRRSRLVGGGAYWCEVRTGQGSASGSHVLDDWLFALEFWRRS